MLRINGFTPNGRTSPGTCHQCGTDVTMRHGHYPGELFHRHYFECATCGKRGMLYRPNCPDCYGGEDGQPIYLIRVGGDCVWRFGKPQNLPVTEQPRQLVQLALF